MKTIISLSAKEAPSTALQIKRLQKQRKVLEVQLADIDAQLSELASVADTDTLKAVIKTLRARGIKLSKSRGDYVLAVKGLQNGVGSFVDMRLQKLETGVALVVNKLVQTKRLGKINSTTEVASTTFIKRVDEISVVKAVIDATSIAKRLAATKVVPKLTVIR